jgi:hypothetical protein
MNYVLLFDVLCGTMLAVCALLVLGESFGGVVEILDRAILSAQKRREKRRTAFRVESIPGTNGYRIRTR